LGRSTPQKKSSFRIIQDQSVIQSAPVDRRSSRNIPSYGFFIPKIKHKYKLNTVIHRLTRYSAKMFFQRIIKYPPLTIIPSVAWMAVVTGGYIMIPVITAITYSHRYRSSVLVKI